MKKSLLVNPFERIAGWPALVAGLCAMALATVIGRMAGIYFDGTLDIHGSHVQHSVGTALLMHGIGWASLVLCLALAGLIFSRTRAGRTRFRMIDLAGTLALARTPYLLLAVALSILPAGLVSTGIISMSSSDIVRVVIFGLACVVLLTWMIWLSYNAYSVSCNIRGVRGGLSFAGGLVAAEALSKWVLVLLLAGGTPARAEAQGVAVADDTLRRTATEVVAAFGRGDYDAVRTHFDATMTRALTAAKLGEVWSSVVEKYGKFVDADTNVAPSAVKGYRVMLIPLRFEHGTARMQIAFNQKGEISGLYIL